MTLCRFRALATDDSPVYFTLADAPVHVSADVIALTARPSSPLLDAKTIARACDHVDLAEGDLVTFRGRSHHVRYNNGFVFECVRTGFCTPTNVLPEYRCIAVSTLGGSFPILFRYKQRSFTWKDIRGACPKGLLIAGCKQPIRPEDIGVNADYLGNKASVFFGAPDKGEKVDMLYGRIHRVGAMSPLGIFVGIGGVTIGPS